MPLGFMTKYRHKVFTDVHAANPSTPASASEHFAEHLTTGLKPDAQRSIPVAVATPSPGAAPHTT